MSDPAHAVRLHILLCDGLSGLSRVVDRLTVLGVVPRVLLFRPARENLGYAHVDLGSIDPAVAIGLMRRLEQFVTVMGVRLTTNSPKGLFATKTWRDRIDRK